MANWLLSARQELRWVIRPSAWRLTSWRSWPLGRTGRKWSETTAVCSAMEPSSIWRSCWITSWSTGWPTPSPLPCASTAKRSTRETLRPESTSKPASFSLGLRWAGFGSLMAPGRVPQDVSSPVSASPSEDGSGFLGLLGFSFGSDRIGVWPCGGASWNWLAVIWLPWQDRLHGTDGCVQLPGGPVHHAASGGFLQIQQLVELQHHGSRWPLCRLRGAEIAGHGDPQLRPDGREALSIAFLNVHCTVK